MQRLVPRPQTFAARRAARALVALPSAAVPGSPLRLTSVDLSIDGNPVLVGITWEVTGTEHWVLLGRNGAGKTSLLRIAAGYAHPTRGEAEVLGERLGRVDVRTLRTRIGFVSANIERRFHPDVTARDAVVTARHGAVVPARFFDIADDDWTRAESLLDLLGCASLTGRSIGTLSVGERQRVMIARSLMPEPELLILDEPAAGLDVGGREQVIDRIATLAALPGGPPIILVSHHVEEIPPGFDKALLLKDGRVMASGPIDEVITDGPMSECFGIPLVIAHEHDRITARLK